MYEVKVSIPEELALALKLSPEKLGDELKLVAAIKLYELGKISSGTAAAFAGVPRVLFLSKLAEYGVNTFDLTEEEIIQDFKNA